MAVINDISVLRKLIEGCQNLDPKSQKEFVERFTPLLMFTAKRYTQDVPSAKDVVQESLINILKSFPRFELDHEASFEAWLRRIVINSALKEKRKSFKRKELNGFENLPEAKHAPKALSNMGLDEIWKLVESLPDGYKKIFQLYVIDDYSHDDIAELLNISASTSRSQLTRARAYLKAICLKNNKSLTQ